MGGRGSWADVHAADPRSDLAVLRLLDKVPGLRPIAFGDGDKVRKGQFVVLLSNPYAAGFRDGSPSASWGIVSNLRRRAPANPDETERARIAIGQGAGRAARLESHLGRNGGDALAGGSRHSRLPVERERHRCSRHSRTARDITDGRAFHFGVLLVRRLFPPRQPLWPSILGHQLSPRYRPGPPRGRRPSRR